MTRYVQTPGFYIPATFAALLFIFLHELIIPHLFKTIEESLFSWLLFIFIAIFLIGPYTQHVLMTKQARKTLPRIPKQFAGTGYLTPYALFLCSQPWGPLERILSSYVQAGQESSYRLSEDLREELGITKARLATFYGVKPEHINYDMDVTVDYVKTLLPTTTKTILLRNKLHESLLKEALSKKHPSMKYSRYTKFDM